MTKRQTPPGRKSKACVVVVKPFGPHHCAKCAGSVHTENTNSRGASSTRVPMIERGSCSRSMLCLPAMRLLPFLLFLFGLQQFQIAVEAIEALFPKSAILLQPFIGFLESPHIDPAGAHLRIPRSRNKARTLQNLQML